MHAPEDMKRRVKKEGALRNRTSFLVGCCLLFVVVGFHFSIFALASFLTLLFFFLLLSFFFLCFFAHRLFFFVLNSLPFNEWQ